MKKEELIKLRAAIADYMYTEGCSCCQNTEGHRQAEEVLAKILIVPKHKDGSGYDFYKFRTL